MYVLRKHGSQVRTQVKAIGSIIASGKLPDLIDGGDGSVTLYQNGLLVAWDPYLEKYPNLKEMYSDEEWDKFRMDEGHIYWANVFGNLMTTTQQQATMVRLSGFRFVFLNGLTILRSDS